MLVTQYAHTHLSVFPEEIRSTHLVRLSKINLGHLTWPSPSSPILRNVYIQLYHSSQSISFTNLLIQLGLHQCNYFLQKTNMQKASQLFCLVGLMLVLVLNSMALPEKVELGRYDGGKALNQTSLRLGCDSTYPVYCCTACFGGGCYDCCAKSVPGCLTCPFCGAGRCPSCLG